MPANQTFFLEQTDQSRIKAKIVKSYFDAWSRIMLRHWSDNIAYVDLYCGPGKYADGQESVPLLLIKEALNNSELTQRMVFLFNDIHKPNTDNLKREIEGLPGGNQVLRQIQFANAEIAADTADSMNIRNSVPVLSFVDPWGYKGLTLGLINKLIENNGSDCIFFFNYNRINMALSNTSFDEHLVGIFGQDMVMSLKSQLHALDSKWREQVILNALVTTLRNNGANYVLPFKFYCQEMLRTSHFIIFVTKHPAGYKIMKSIMYSNSAKDIDGVATFSFEDPYNFGGISEQLSLFSRPLESLCCDLLKKHKGMKVNVKGLCDTIMCDTGNAFVEANVKDALRRLEAQGKVSIEGRKQRTRNGVPTMPDGAFALFS